jgi:putative endonuclease
MYYVYILKSKVNDSFYIGHSHDLIKRLKEHNAGRVKSKKAKRPWKIHYFEEYHSKSEAFK